VDNISIAVLWVTRNRCKDLVRSIESVLCQTKTADELVIVDNCSDDNTVETVAKQYPQIKIIQIHKNLGCPSARNIGLVNCASQIIYFLDDDGWLNPKALEYALKGFSHYPRTAIVMSRIIHVTDSDEENIIINNEKVCILNNFVGCATAIKKNAFIECGGFPDDFFRQAEEVALSLYIIDKGYTIVYEPKSIMFHQPSPIERLPVQFCYYQLRNSIRIGYRQVPFPFWPGKIISQLWHAIRLSVMHRNFLLAIKVYGRSILDLHLLFSERNPIHRKTFKQFRKINKT